MAAFEMKEKWLRLLVDKEILTEEECEKCIDILKKDDDDVLNDRVCVPPAVTNEYLYEDSRVRIQYKGIQSTSNLFYGKGFSIRFLVENKTSRSMRVHGKEMTINGFMVDDDCWLVSGLPANKKTIGGLNVFHGTLEQYDIDSESDFESIGFKIMTEFMEDGKIVGNTEKESCRLELDIKK